METNMTTVYFALAGLLCLASVGIFVYIAVQMFRGGGSGSEAKSPGRAVSPAPPRSVATPQAPGGAHGGHGGLPVGDPYDEEEMPTVIVNQPPPRPPKPSEPKAPPPGAGRRSAGATIIAFDDEDDDD